MEKQIKQIIDLANQYYQLSLDLNLKDDEHNYFRGDTYGHKHLATYDFTKQSNDDREIRVYLADNKKTWAVNFGGIEYHEYSDKITFPSQTTSEKLQEVYDDALEFLNSITKHR